MAEDQTANTMITHLCHICGVATTYWCSRCHNVWYCSVEHMQNDWPSHRFYCHPFEETQGTGGATRPEPVRNTTYPPALPSANSSYNNGSGRNPARSNTIPPGSRPTSIPEPNGNTTTTSFQAVLFPYNEERPRLVEVQCLAQPQSSGPTLWTPMPQEQLGNVGDVTSMIITHGVGGAPLRFPLHLFYGTNSFADGSPLNQVIARMTAGKSIYQWSGNIVALKFSGSRRQGYTDATYNDVAPLIASFLARPGESS